MRPDTLWGKRILEVGLGYGTLAQLLAAVGEYTGLDIAQGPVELVKERLRLKGLLGKVIQGSILEPIFEPESFDSVVTIGCLHHTGDLPLAIRQIHRLLRPGGSLTFMVYNAYSYRRWMLAPGSTVGFLLSEYLTIKRRSGITAAERAAYDKEDVGEAPETQFFSVRQLKKLLSGFQVTRVTKENGTPELLFKKWSREDILHRIAPYFGLDLYIQATKSSQVIGHERGNAYAPRR